MTLPTSIHAALDELEAAYPSYSASAARARLHAERIIEEALLAAARPGPASIHELPRTRRAGARALHDAG